MSGHDPACCLDDMLGPECPVCASIAAARREELDKFNSSWQANIAAVEARNYREGYADCGAGRPPRVDLIGPRT